MPGWAAARPGALRWAVRLALRYCRLRETRLLPLGRLANGQVAGAAATFRDGVSRRVGRTSAG